MGVLCSYDSIRILVGRFKFGLVMRGPPGLYRTHGVIGPLYITGPPLIGPIGHPRTNSQSDTCYRTRPILCAFIIPSNNNLSDDKNILPNTCILPPVIIYSR